MLHGSCLLRVFLLVIGLVSAAVGKAIPRNSSPGQDPTLAETGGDDLEPAEFFWGGGGPTGWGAGGPWGGPWGGGPWGGPWGGAPWGGPWGGPWG